MMKKLSSSEINLVIEKIRQRYNTLINEFKLSKVLSDNFEERYLSALKTAKDLSVFLLAEIEVADELYNNEVKKREESEKKKALKNQKSYADIVYDENLKKMQKYPIVNFHENASEDIKRLTGAIRFFLTRYWPVIIFIFQNDRTSKNKLILDNYYDKLLLKINFNGIPPIVRTYIAAIERIPADNKRIETEYYFILKDLAFLLNEIRDILKKILNEKDVPEKDNVLSYNNLNDREWYNIFKNLRYGDCIIKVFNTLTEIINDFRIKDIKKNFNTF